jgi:hypothetical protein
MTELSLPNVSVASSGGEYFQVSFDEKKDSEDMEDSQGAYFLIQRQFESPDGGRVYIESHERSLCGHFRIKKAELHREVFRLELMSRPACIIQIKFQADEKQFGRLKRVLRIMCSSGVLRVE